MSPSKITMIPACTKCMWTIAKYLATLLTTIMISLHIVRQYRAGVIVIQKPAQFYYCVYIFY